MSVYSDWKCGALTYDEYRQEAEYEARRDEYLENEKCADEEEGEE